jgi:2-polyprenyl-3-methyl-5-hydroxy-6-metoxy-1,4-benzoquinol methylase
MVELSNRTSPLEELQEVVSPFPNLARLISATLSAWPEHAEYLRKSLAVRSPGMMQTTELAAQAVLALSGENIAKFADNYRWLCDRIMEEELDFARTGRYRYSTFAETNAHVYSDAAFMERYMHGLLLSHVLWFMHASSLHFFRERLETRVARGGRVLEVGSGHGLLLYLALRDLGMTEAHGWDLSAVSLQQTRDALTLLGASDQSHFAIKDMQAIEPGEETFDLIILSHILEHIEDPVSSLKSIRNALNKTGLLFVNVPLNAPMPDHIILLSDPVEAETMLREGGFRIVETATHVAQATTLSLALKRQTAVTCSIIAEKRA